jgi:hypothetical protein
MESTFQWPQKLRYVFGLLAYLKEIIIEPDEYIQKPKKILLEELREVKRKMLEKSSKKDQVNFMEIKSLEEEENAIIWGLYNIKHSKEVIEHINGIERMSKKNTLSAVGLTRTRELQDWILKCIYLCQEAFDKMVLPRRGIDVFISGKISGIRGLIGLLKVIYYRIDDLNDAISIGRFKELFIVIRSLEYEVALISEYFKEDKKRSKTEIHDPKLYFKDMEKKKRQALLSKYISIDDNIEEIFKFVLKKAKKLELYHEIQDFLIIKGHDKRLIRYFEEYGFLSILEKQKFLKIMIKQQSLKEFIARYIENASDQKELENIEQVINELRC